jgi:hypothetical protein
MPTIAGHTFEMAPDGRRCVTGECRKLWADISYATKDDIGKSGWAHTGTLSQPEYDQIVAERNRLWELGRGA